MSSSTTGRRRNVVVVLATWFTFGVSGEKSPIKQLLRPMLPHRVHPWPQFQHHSYDELIKWACEAIRNVKEFDEGEVHHVKVCKTLTGCASFTACKKEFHNRAAESRYGRYRNKWYHAAMSRCRALQEQTKEKCVIAPPGNIPRSQIHDAFSFVNFFNTTHGTFFEMGAEDGLTGALTLFFEHSLLWSGILVEPQPESYRKTCRNRPRATSLKVNKCVHPTLRTASFSPNGPMGGVVADGSKEGEWLVARNRAAEGYGDTKGYLMPKTIKLFFKKDYINVSCAPLSEVLRSHDGITRRGVDFFSLDVEGFELQVLRSFDWSVPLHVITIENNLNNAAIDDLLASKGFDYVTDYQTNNYWINRTWWRSSQGRRNAGGGAPVVSIS